METSAKVNEGVEDAFFTLARQADLTQSAWMPLTTSSAEISRQGSLTRIQMLVPPGRASRKTTVSKLARLQELPQVVAEHRLHRKRNAHDIVVQVELLLRIISLFFGCLSLRFRCPIRCA
jgi:hypothetical protein